MPARKTKADGRSGVSDPEELLEQARRVVRIEAEAVSALLGRLDRSFVRAVEMIYGCTGRVIVSGVGKSGIVGRKLATTLTSTGTPALFIHPVDCLHGDMGLVRPEDIFIAVSRSGETDEIEQLLHFFKRLGVKIIAVAGRADSSLSRMADVVLDVSVAREACPHDLAPTASTTAAMVMGDALAVSLLLKRNFGPEDFAALHPAGTLGRRMLLKVSEVMLSGEDTPMVRPQARMKEVLIVLVGKRGICPVVDEDRRLVGVVTDGDFKRLLSRTADFMDIPVAEVMTGNPKSIHPDELCITAAKKMEQFSIISMPVVDDRERLVGVVHLHDLMRARVI
ncbi:MAG: KpsF/GutQ family sugar-phosphate isomerase [Candidatus Glassbacteria bacterium]|nr:KpsF/GutQ family sugar-phosphate isomerase [Candidatus Glassbacteria bacterium]